MIQINIKDLEPFTYYRNTKTMRGFLLVDVLPGEEYGNKVVLIEFGQTRHNPIRHELNDFIILVNSGSMEKFTPKIN